jgi:hypothetical protein
MNKTNFSPVLFLSHLVPSLHSGQNQAPLFRPIIPPPTIHPPPPVARSICRLPNSYKDITLMMASAMFAERLQPSIFYEVYSRKPKLHLLYRVFQEERSLFWEVIVSVILSKKVYMYTCPILNRFRDRAISLYSSKIVDKKEITYCF